MSRDLYARMGNELRSLFKELESLDPIKVQEVRWQMDRIVHTAEEIGGPLKDEADRLKTELSRFLEHPRDTKAKKKLQEHALRLEQETREL